MSEGENGQELCFNTILTGDGRLKGFIFILFYSIVSCKQYHLYSITLPVLFVLPVSYDMSRESISETKKLLSGTGRHCRAHARHRNVLHTYASVRLGNVPPRLGVVVEGNHDCVVNEPILLVAFIDVIIRSQLDVDKQWKRIE